MAEPLLSTPQIIIEEIAKWHYELLCEMNPKDPVCPTRVWEKPGKWKLIKLMGQPAATVTVNKPATPPADYDTVFECDGQTITLNQKELAILGTKHHFGRNFTMLDLI